MRYRDWVVVGFVVSVEVRVVYVSSYGVYCFIYVGGEWVSF